MSIDGFTYIFVPDFFLSELSGNLSLTLPELSPANFTATLSQNDSASIPSGVNPDNIPVLGRSLLGISSVIYDSDFHREVL